MPDVVTIVTQTYRTLWAERFYILRLSVVPIAVIYINFLMVQMMGDDVSVLRRGLYIIPAMIAESWIVAQFLRTFLTKERWPMSPPTGMNDPVFPARLARARALLAAMIFYVLVSLATNALAGVLAGLMPVGDVPAAPDPAANPIFFIVFLVLMIGVLQFRMLWLYIPLVMGQPLARFVRATNLWIVNIQLIGVWLATVVPVFMAVMLVIKPLVLIETNVAVAAFILMLVTSAFQVVAQLVLALAASVAVAVAVSPVLFGGQNGR